MWAALAQPNKKEEIHVSRLMAKVKSQRMCTSDALECRVFLMLQGILQSVKMITTFSLSISLSFTHHHTHTKTHTIKGPEGHRFGTHLDDGKQERLPDYR